MLLRHAKAVSNSRGDDFARDLQEKGKADAARLGGYLADRAIVPDLAFVSSSARTRQTFDGMRAALPRPFPTIVNESLYNATAAEICELVQSIEPDVATLLIVGHNPGVADAAVMLSRDGDVTDIDRMSSKYPPCGLAIIGFDTDDWRDARPSQGRLDLFLLPEDLEP